MEMISTDELVRHYLNLMHHSLDEMEKSENMIKQMIFLIEQEMKGAIAESLHEKLEECKHYMEDAYDEAERTRYGLALLLALDNV